MRYTQTTLKKLEDVFTELDYSVRYEKALELIKKAKSAQEEA